MEIREDMMIREEFAITFKEKKIYKIFDRDYTVKVFFMADEDEQIQECQKQALEEFNNISDKILDEVADLIYEHYQEVYEEYRDMFEDWADEYAPIISSKSELAEVVTLLYIGVERSEKNDRVVIVIFDTKWNYEYGLGAKIVNEKIVKFGVQAEVL